MNHLWPAALLVAASLGGSLFIITMDDRPPASLQATADPRNQVQTLGPLFLAKSNSRVTSTFTLHNDTGHPLVLQKPKLGCGCSSAELDQTELPPRATARLTVHINLFHGFEGVKSVVTKVAAQSGEEWTLQTQILAVRTLIAPLQITIDRTGDPNATGAEAQIQVRAATTEELAARPLAAVASSDRFRVDAIDFDDTDVTVAGESVRQREYRYRISLDPARPVHTVDSLTIRWTAGDTAATSSIGVSLPSPATHAASTTSSDL